MRRIILLRTRIIDRMTGFAKARWMKWVPVAVLPLMLLGCDASPDQEQAANSVANQEPPGSLAEQAMAELNTALAASPGDADLLAQRGELFYENQIYDRAIADLKASIQADSTRAAVWHLLADAQLDGLRSRDALSTMIFASSQFPERMGTLLKLAEYQYILRKYEDALATLDRAARLDQNEGEVYFMLGQVFSEAGDTVRAINAYQRATELKPDLLDSWLSLGALYEARGDAIAERYYNTATAIDRTNALPFRMRADYYTRQDRLEEAVAAYDEVIVLDPRMAEAFYNSGLVLMDMDSLDRAIGQLDRAIAIRPGYAEAHYFRGLASELQGNLSDARRRYQQALNIQPGYELAQQSLQALEPAQ